MSTKASILYGDGYHMYSDVLVDMNCPPGSGPIFLELSECDFECNANGGFTNLTVVLPREIAVKLGLMPAPSEGKTDDQVSTKETT